MYKYYLGLKYLVSRKINLLGIIGVMVGVWALVLVISIFSGFIREVRSHIRGAASDISFVAKWGAEWSGAGVPTPGPPSYQEVEKLILADPNVAACAPRLVSYGLIDSGAPKAQYEDVQFLDQDPLSHNVVQVIGIDPAREAKVTEFNNWLANVKRGELRVEDLSKPFRVPPERIRGRGTDGSSPGVRQSDPGILVGEDRFDRGPNMGNAVIGTPIRLAVAVQTGSAYRILSLEFALAGAFSSRHSTFDRQSVLVPIDVLRSLLGHDPQSEPYIDVFHEAAIALRDYGTADETIKRLTQTIGRQRGVAFTWEERNKTFLEAVNHERGLMKLVLFVIFVVAGFLIFATLSMMVTEKTHDIGILTAMGATRRGILSIFLICGAVIGFGGCLLGIVAGYLSSIHLNDVNQWVKLHFDVELFPTLIYKLKEVPYELDPVWMAQVGLLAMVLALVFAFIPAWRAARFDPVDALRYE